MFVDQIQIEAHAGRGGDGVATFRREKFVPRGGPDGGDGGKGGDVILEAHAEEDHLIDFFYQPILRAEEGKRGRGRQMTGRGGRSVISKVPVGTLIYRIVDSPPAEPEQTTGEGDPSSTSGNGRELIADLNQPGQRVVLCRGGEGGKGNVHFKSSRNRTPQQFTEGGEGEEGRFYLELRMMADVGLVGYPNAGKSTLLQAVSAAHPKIASYPFTTLQPSVGVVEFRDLFRMTVADIPGLMEGAHRNVGLGHRFLRHIMRCPVLLFVLDTAGSEARNPVADLEALRRELSLYDRALSSRPWVVAANKMDLPEAADHLKVLRNRFPKITMVPVVAPLKEGIPELLKVLREKLEECRGPDDTQAEGDVVDPPGYGS